MSAIACRIPGCDGMWHADGGCFTELASLPVGEGAALHAEHEAFEGEAPSIVVYGFGQFETAASRMTDPASVRELAARYRAFADSLDQGATLLAPPASAPEPIDHAARFAALDADLLFDLENQDGDTDAPGAHIESLLIVLAEWRPRILALLANGPAWSIPEVAAYERALSRTREAWLLWNFRWVGGPDLPDTFDLPEPVASVSVTDANVARITSAGRRSLTVREMAA